MKKEWGRELYVFAFIWERSAIACFRLGVWKLREWGERVICPFVRRKRMNHAYFWNAKRLTNGENSFFNKKTRIKRRNNTDKLSAIVRH